MGGICIILVFMGYVMGEKTSGSAVLTLTKKLSHTSFTMAKFVTVAAAFCLLSASICSAYTRLIFEYASELTNILLGVIAYAVFTITLLASTISQSTNVSAVLAFGGFIILMLSNYVPKIGFILPCTLLSKTVELSSGIFYSGIVGLIILSSCLSVICLSLSVSSLKRQ